MDSVEKLVDDEATESESKKEELLWQQPNKRVGASAFNNGIDVDADKETKRKIPRENTQDSQGKLTTHVRTVAIAARTIALTPGQLRAAPKELTDAKAMAVLTEMCMSETFKDLSMNTKMLWKELQYEAIRQTYGYNPVGFKDNERKAHHISIATHFNAARRVLEADYKDPAAYRRATKLHLETVLQASQSGQFSPEDRDTDTLEVSKPTSTLAPTLPPHNVSPVELESTTDLAKATVSMGGAEKSDEELKGIVFFHNNKPINNPKTCFQRETSNEPTLSSTAGICKPQSASIRPDSCVIHAAPDTPRKDNPNMDGSSISVVSNSNESTENPSTVSLRDGKGSNESSRSTEGNGEISLQAFKGTSSTDSDPPMTDRNESMKGKPKDSCTSSDDSGKEPAVAECSEIPKTSNEPARGSESDFRPSEGGTTDRDDQLASHKTGEHAQSKKTNEENNHHHSSSMHTSECPDPDEEVAQAIDSNVLQEGEVSCGGNCAYNDESIQPSKASDRHPVGECSDDRPEVAELADSDGVRLTKDGCCIPLRPPKTADGTSFAHPCSTSRKLSSQSSMRTAVSSTPMTSAVVANASLPADNEQNGRDADLKKRTTKDGCFLPKTAPKKKEDGTFAHPCGRKPPGMVWDEVRGLYAPKSKSTVSANAIQSNKRTRDTSSENEEGADEQEEDFVMSDNLTDEQIENARKQTNWTEAQLHNRMAEDGSFPPHPTYQAALKKDHDGLYLRPPGRCPTNTVWDPRCGRYVQKGEELSITGKRGKVSSVASPSNEDQTNKRQKRDADKSIASGAAAAPESYPPPSNGTLSIAQLESSHVKKRRHTIAKIGTRVYAEWPKPKGWHFATVMDVKRQPGSRFNRYSLLFDDGDLLELASISKFILDEEYRAAGYAEPFPPIPRAHTKKVGKILKPASTIGVATDRMNVDSRSILTLEELLQQACGECSHCQKPDCGQCASCLTNQNQVCIQKMCCKISIKRKAQPMPPSSKFPEGWRYAIVDPTMPNYVSQKAKIHGVIGLKLFPPTGIYSYYSVEAAMSYPNYAKALADVSPEGFYQHVGAHFSGSPRRETVSPLSLPQVALSVHRVKGSRVYCSANETWGIIQNKVQLSNGLFRYSVRLENDNTFRHGICDEDLVTEVGYLRKTGRDPPPPVELAIVDCDTNCCKNRGMDVVVTTENVLVGRKFFFAWLDVNGQKNEVRGSVIACEFNKEADEVISCLVAYNQKSRALANSTLRGSLVPEYHWLDPALVVGGCMSYEEQFSRSSDRLSELTNPPVHSTWINPDLRHEKTMNGLPVLRLAYRGYVLEFRVGESSIENAGKGAFVSCTSLEGDDADFFHLEAGVFLDLGVYGGDFRPDGRKTEAAFIVKNFMHLHKCEEFAFDPRDQGYQLDITDDVTGDLHAVARNSVLPYVNEGDDNQVCIHPMHDPANLVHYLLGNPLESGRKFVLSCDGIETEVFTDYGKGYEKVRVKRGYSSLSEGANRKAFEEELENDDFTDIETISSFCAKEIENAVNFMFNLFAAGEESQFSDPVMIERALLCAVVLQQRAKHLFLEEDDDLDALDPSPVNLLQNLQMSRAVVVSILKLCKGDSYREWQQLQAAGDAKGLWKVILGRQQFPDEQLETLESLITEV